MTTLSKLRRTVFTLAVVGGMAFATMPIGSAMAQEEDGSIFGGLFTGGDAKPLFVKPNTKMPTGRATTGTASQTGVARTPSTNYRSNALNITSYNPNNSGQELSVSELLDQDGARDMAASQAFREQKLQESEEMAEIYRQQMEERLAAEANTSALSAMGGGGTGGVDSEEMKKMIYKKKDDSYTGTKPIRLFKIQ